MKRTQLHRFFRILAQEFDAPATIVVTGAAAGSVWGHVRPSVDVDFAVSLKYPTRSRWAQFAAAIERTSQRTGLQANYAPDIDRWGAISLLDYRRHTSLYLTVGRLAVRLLDPAYWTIGKLTRYLDPDVRDLVVVLKRQRLDAGRLARLWGRALRASPPSTASTQFRQQAEHFLRTHGRYIWGRGFDMANTIAAFHHAAKIIPPEV